jgi:ABC-type polysaccharide/polyol phosphate transport system ATPase subunit
MSFKIEMDAVTAQTPNSATLEQAGQTIIDVENLSKAYRLYGKPLDRLKQAFAWNRREYFREIRALNGINFRVQRGQTVGIIGRNGSGKSTLLQIISGTLTPTDGQVSIGGRVSALLELGSGFNPDFTGKENVYLNGAILGLSPRQVAERFDAIEDFAEIGQAIHQPVKTYSTGMVVRLAFSVLAHLDPEILIIDEALAVGDVYFQTKCFQFLKDFTSCGGTLLFVSHAMDTVIQLADYAILLDEGRITSAGAPENVSKDYARLVTRLHAEHAKPPKRDPADGAQRTRSEFRVDSDVRYGTRESEIVSIELFDAGERPARVFESGSELTLRMTVLYHTPVASPCSGIDVKLPNDMSVFTNTTLAANHKIPAQQAGDTLQIEHRFTLNLIANTYVVALGVGELKDGSYVPHDRLHHATDFEIIPAPNQSGGHGIAALNHRFKNTPART